MQKPSSEIVPRPGQKRTIGQVYGALGADGVPSDVQWVEGVHALMAAATGAHGIGAARWLGSKIARYGAQAVVRYYNSAAGRAALRAAGRSAGRSLLPI